MLIWCVFLTRRSRARNYDAELLKCRPEATLVEFGDYHPLKPIMVCSKPAHITAALGVKTAQCVHSLSVHHHVLILSQTSLTSLLRWRTQKPAVGLAKAAPPHLPPLRRLLQRILLAQCWMGQILSLCSPQRRLLKLRPCHTVPLPGFVHTTDSPHDK